MMSIQTNGVRLPDIGFTQMIEGSSITDMHLFSPSQPDLNWDNPEVRNAVFDVIDFWGQKGTDGFRVYQP